MDKGTESYRRFRDEGDDTGMVEIIRDYKDGLIFYLNSFVCDLHTAESLAEDTFVLLGVKRPRDSGRGSFKTWLYTIGRHIAIDHIRRRTRRAEVPLEECGQMAAQEQSLEQAYLRDEQKITLHRAMESLKPEYRQVLWLVYFENMSSREAAAVMKKTTHNIETLAYRARRALRAQLEKEGFTCEGL